MIRQPSIGDYVVVARPAEMPFCAQVIHVYPGSPPLLDLLRRDEDRHTVPGQAILDALLLPDDPVEVFDRRRGTWQPGRIARIGPHRVGVLHDGDSPDQTLLGVLADRLRPITHEEPT